MVSDGRAPGRVPSTIQVISSLIAIGLLAITLFVPFWSMKLEAPQYPSGLRLTAYGTEIGGDLREINILNHYVGMGHIDSKPAPEMALFNYAIFALMALCVLAPIHRRLAHLAILACVGMPLVVLADLQWWLHTFGRNLDPRAPLDVEPFTPLALGVSTIHNFVSKAWVSWGFFCMIGAAAVLAFGLRVSTRQRRAREQGAGAANSGPGAGRSSDSVASVSERASRSQATPLLLGALLCAAAASATTAAPLELPSSALAGHLPNRSASRQATPSEGQRSLQEAISAAARGSTVFVEAGIYRGRIVIEGPLTLVGVDRPVIDGGGDGSVVTISGEGVVFRGFEVRHSGRAVTQEAAGIKVTGSGHRIEDNIVDDVYFGIHLADGGSNWVIGNRITPGHRPGARPGHAVSLWHQNDTRILDNHISKARDGIYLTFADNVLAENNFITGCRYGVHSMYSEDSTFVCNSLSMNLLGSALMYSNGLEMRCNRIADHREGATAYGVLLKDIDDLVMENNLIIGNRVGIYADSTPLGPGREAIVRGNVILGNDSALALQSNVGLTFYGNLVTNNLIDVRTQGSGLSSRNRWSVDGRGNYWDQYQGYDQDGDGIGDIPYRYELVMNEMIQRTPLVRAFIYTPASQALERAARLFPLYTPDPLLVDAHPMMSVQLARCLEEGL
jgi:nitrous oxidase accessory protein